MTLTSTARTIIITNIVALVGAAATIIWNTAILTKQIRDLTTDQARQGAVQMGLIVDQEKLKDGQAREEQARILLDGRIFRLEDLNLRRTR